MRRMGLKSADMRDAVFFLFFEPMPLVSLLLPWLGLLAWGWIAFMQPHRALWGFAEDVPFNLIIALATIVGWIIWREKRLIGGQATVLLSLALLGMVGIAHLFSISP